MSLSNVRASVTETSERERVDQLISGSIMQREFWKVVFEVDNADCAFIGEQNEPFNIKPFMSPKVNTVLTVCVLFSSALY